MNINNNLTIPKDLKRLLFPARRALYWSLPWLILYLVFRRVDLNQLMRVVADASPAQIALGLVLNVPVVAFGAFRWHFLLRRYNVNSMSPFLSFREYWKSLAVGVLTPGSLGSDAYRVMVAGRCNGRYLRGAFAIGVEKLAALLSCFTLIAVLYPLLAPSHLPTAVTTLVDVLYALILVGGLLVISILFARGQRWGWGRRLVEMLNVRLEKLARKVENRVPSAASRNEMPQNGGGNMILSSFSPSIALPVVGLSLVVHTISAVQVQLYFQALGYPVSYAVNLFVTPMLFLLVTLPISFGGIGVREGGNILLYGAFGVPAEIALLVSFCSLLSIVCSYTIGAFLFLCGGQFPVKNRILADGTPRNKLDQATSVSKAKLKKTI